MTAITAASSLWDLVEQRCAISADRPFLLEGTDTVVTFDEFKGRCERVAAGFAATGIGVGTPVVWQLPTSVDSIVAAVALSRLGAVQTPILHLYREKEVGFCIEQAQPHTIVVPGMWGGHDYAAMATSLASDPTTRIVALDKGLPEGEPATLPPLAPSPTSASAAPIRWVYYTSGTTSDPKGVQHTDQTLLAAGVGLAKAIEATEDDIGSMVFPFAHIAGPDYLIMMLSAGMPAMLLDAFALDRAIELYNHWNCTLAGGSTVFYTMFLGEQRKQPDQPLIDSLRMLAGGGAPMPAEIYHEVVAEMGVPVCHGYGMTECPMIAQGGPADSADQLSMTDGHPVNGCEVSIVALDGTPCATGEVGEIRVAGPMLFVGYTDESLNAESFDEQGRFCTGDLGYVRDDGHVCLTGRIKDVIIRKGENVSATEVEDVLYTHPAIGAVAVIGIPDRDRGELVCAVVETAEGAADISLDAVAAHCTEAGLMRQKVPERVEIIDRMPRNDTLQKVLKYKLREMYS